MTRNAKPTEAEAVPTFGARVVIVESADTPSGSEVARSSSGNGVVAILVGQDAAKLGLLAAELTEIRNRCAVFVGDTEFDEDRGALAAMVQELFGSQE